MVRSPRYNITTAQTTVSTASGETIVLGGLITKNEQRLNRSVPYCRTFPWWAGLFRYDQYRSKRTELLIILTPHVVRSSADAERLKQIEAARMHWCAADVHAIHGDPEFCRRGECPTCNEQMPVVYPDLDPRGLQNVPSPAGGVPVDAKQRPSSADPGVSADNRAGTRARERQGLGDPATRTRGRFGQAASHPASTRSLITDNMLRRQSNLGWIIGGPVAGLVVGCAPLKLPHKLALPLKGDKPQPPQRITALWTDTVLVEAGVVGFGGRVMFYGRNDEDPIMVAGEMTVFAYDDTENPGSIATPARKFVFRSEELAKHYSKSTLGHSYSFWVPWGPVGGPKRQISLVTRFKSDAGGVVMSEMTKHFLPGVTPSAVVVDEPQAPGSATPQEIRRRAPGSARQGPVSQDERACRRLRSICPTHWATP